MGLVIQAPTDAAALPGLTAAGPAEGDAQAPGKDVFAALLQSLLGEGTAVAAEGTPDALLALPDAPVKDEKAADNPLGDALAGAVALLQLLPQAVPVEIVVDNPTNVASTIGAPTPAEDTGLAGEAALPLPDSIDTPAGDGAATVPAPVTQVAATDSAPNSAPPASDTAGLAAVAATGEAEAVEPPASTRPRAAEKAHGVDDPPPTEAGTAPAVSEQSSVVRFAGNANNQNQGHGHEPTDGGGQGVAVEATVHPRASAEGISHAAANSAVGQLRTDAPAAGSEVPSAGPSSETQIPQPVQQVSRAVLEQVSRGDGEARIHLDPVELGEITIRVKTEGDHVRVEIHAERAEAMNLLRDHSADLSSLLGSRGLNLSDVFVGLGGQGARHSQGGEQQRGERPANGQFAAILGAGETPTIELHNRLRSAYNPDGAHSYRV